ELQRAPVEDPWLMWIEGSVHFMSGRAADAIEAFLAADRAAGSRPDWRQPTAQLVEQCQSHLELSREVTEMRRDPDAEDPSAGMVARFATACTATWSWDDFEWLVEEFGELIPSTGSLHPLGPATVIALAGRHLKAGDFSPGSKAMAAFRLGLGDYVTRLELASREQSAPTSVIKEHARALLSSLLIAQTRVEATRNDAAAALAIEALEDRLRLLQ
ncbi:MAG: hypothetical protein KDB53_13145, partial [Planctomycetes bacterium]|nr:hypothetical protein [Planctomycetota bacterium]